MKRARTGAVCGITLAITAGGALAQPNTVTIDGAFADWADEYCVADPGACDDFPNQQDTKGACIASNFAATDPAPATTAYLRFDFDDTSVAGANTLDACWLVDVDADGNANVALCMELGGGPLVLTSFLYTCNDSSPSCGGPVLAGSQPQACAFTAALAPADQLECAAAADAAIECSAPLSALGWVSGNVTLLAGCTFGSAQPNSADHDCATEGGPLVIDPTDGDNTPVELLSFEVD